MKKIDVNQYRFFSKPFNDGLNVKITLQDGSLVEELYISEKKAFNIINKIIGVIDGDEQGTFVSFLSKFTMYHLYINKNIDGIKIILNSEPISNRADKNILKLSLSTNQGYDLIWLLSKGE